MTYWHNKRLEHEKAVKLWSWWSAVGAIFGILVMLLGGMEFLPDSTSTNQIPWKDIGAFVMLATIVVWLMRFPFKMLLSNIHLRGDAKEREVMIETYMALLRGKDGENGLSPENIMMVLTPIFRPATSGIIHDDGGPATYFESMTKIVK